MQRPTRERMLSHVHPASHAPYPYHGPARPGHDVGGVHERYERKTMSKVVLELSVSLDGFITGPEVSPEAPLGRGGERLPSAW